MCLKKTLQSAIVLDGLAVAMAAEVEAIVLLWQLYGISIHSPG